jgi:thiamine pyrophosphate-dependent acetolactate synthase large subunit-like protein
MGISGDAETSMPWLIRAVEQEMTPARKSAVAARGQKLKEAGAKLIQVAHDEAAMAWDSSPISTARTSAEVWNQIKNEDWTMASEVNFLSNWPYRLWSMEKHYHSMGGSVGGGVGYNAPAALGAALANKEHGRITVALNGDGDLMMSPGILWTAAHHKIPILYIVHNNRAWHQEYMHVQRMANRNQRGIDRAWIGTTMHDPNIDFATLAKSMGVYSQGPIDRPADLGPAIQRAIAVVKRGEPALIDVVSQPR